MGVSIKFTIKAAVCFATLKEMTVKEIMNAIDFEEIKAREIVIMLRNDAMSARRKENGEGARRDFRIGEE